ncbi:MAG TPA: twin-arginine translocase TatA/TatE family subunit [Armatimonadota bacterium]|nr:twin-arginine translocase TatA/TatE family subunit [Armatimonadota bacterium]
MFGGSFGGQEIIVVLVLVLVLFGAKRIPDIMRGFGQGLREFKEASQKAMDEIDSATTTVSTTATNTSGSASVGASTAVEAPTPEESPADSSDAE